MLRDMNINEETDGKKYALTDMVKADCNDCQGCSACCQGMGNSIVLDPLDVYRLSTCLGKRFEALLESEIELNMVDGIILPNLKMTANEAAKTDSCVFLNAEGRCSIHAHRPGICRIFPLGRLYENGDFSYILQVHECKKENKSKVKVSKWIDTPDLKNNQAFIRDWHYFLKAVQERLLEKQDDAFRRTAAMQILQFFYIEPFASEQVSEQKEGAVDSAASFYEQFYIRLEHAKKLFLS